MPDPLPAEAGAAAPVGLERPEWAACRRWADDEAERVRHYPTVLVAGRLVLTSWKEWRDAYN